MVTFLTASFRRRRGDSCFVGLRDNQDTISCERQPTAGRVRILWMNFLLSLTAGCASLSSEDPSVRLSEVTLLGDLDCFKIETPTATYLYGKRGAGFASIVDPSGHDWISYRHGGKALGEYRGLPKCGQPVKYFHCGYGYGQYTNENWFTSTILERSPRHI